MKTMHSTLQGIALWSLGAALGAGATGQLQRAGEARPSALSASPAKTAVPPIRKTASVTPKKAAPHAPRRKRLSGTTQRSTPVAPHDDAPLSLSFYFPTTPSRSFRETPPQFIAHENSDAKEKAAIQAPALTTLFFSGDEGNESCRAAFSLALSPNAMRQETTPFLLSTPDITPRKMPVAPAVHLAQLETTPVEPTPVEPTPSAPTLTERKTQPATSRTVIMPPVIENGALRDLLNESDLTGVFAGRPVVNGVLTPERAVEIALHESPVIRGATAEVEAALGRLDAARAGRRPMVSANTFLSGGTIPNIIESPQAIQPSMIMGLPRGSFFDQNLMVMFPLFTGGRIKAMVRQATALRNASQAELQAQRQEVALLTRLAFREAQARRALVEVQQARLRENEEQLRIDRVRAQEGKIPPFFVLRSEAEVAATQQELVNARRDVELSLLQLQTVMGISPASQIEITDALSYEPSAPFLQQLAPVSQNATTDLAALLRLAERQRPELQAAEQQVLAAQAETSAVRSAYRPQINAFGMGDVMKMQGEKMTGGVAFGVVASVSIFDGGQKRARVATAEAERRRQEAERQRLILQVGQEVATSMLNLRTGELNIQTADAALKSAQEDYRVARIRYESGRSTLVEVLDALAARVRAEGNVVQALFTYNTARDQLRRAVGEDPARASDGELKR